MLSALAISSLFQLHTAGCISCGVLLFTDLMLQGPEHLFRCAEHLISCLQHAVKRVLCVLLHWIQHSQSSFLLNATCTACTECSVIREGN